MTLQVYEVFEKISKAKNREDKIQVLKDNDHWAVRDVIRGSMDPSVSFLLPAGKPPYKPSSAETPPSSLLRENRKFAYIVKGNSMGEAVNSIKRESIFIGILESIHPSDAELVVNMVAKKTPVKGLTKKIVEEAYPGLIR